MKRDQILLIAAGGTGGHIFPGLTVAEEMRSRGYKIVWVGNKNSMESKIVSQKGIPMQFLSFNGVRSKGWFPWLVLPFTLLKAFFVSIRLLVKVSPSVVLVMGGYLSLPVGLASFFLGKPFVLHEQNSYAGWSNRILSLFATRILTAFPNVFRRGEEVGNPLSRDFWNVDPPEIRYMLRSIKPLQIFVVGGSLGANFLNKLLPDALALLPFSLRPNVLHQTGEKHISSIREYYANCKVLDIEKVELVAFIENMAAAYKKADLVICRGGAMTVSEICTIGVAALFVPYPFAVDDHQTKNVQCLVKSGAADVIMQNELTPEWLALYFTNLTRISLAKKAQYARNFAKSGSVGLIADICIAAAKLERD